MLVTRYNPFKELRELENRLFNYYPSAPSEEGDISAFKPSVSTREGEFAYHIEVDIPGVKKEDIHIDLKENQLIISGERSFKEERKENDYYKIESSYGKFQRSFALPENVDVENIEASSENGVLEVVLPKLKVEKAEVKKIQVK
ncbi:Hsp20/alpha crystallin family protein [Sulfurospirillum barnesii]|uniref:Molecular chaperone (Small heat shock protein) n=1 Tax=Sulfurospirillum barnesii (strain ATCC 700032 / DSM 10660 / SES-3) TaxID=760154 RepID=I3XUY1_SULBS|nr:Hsp20/alpha crystallin family protein [Sulfurospirillum barnesii]AFL67755.1 molecular chaperone (small heat shock protein) [Sulfurospirillum barnesii SES-3]